VAESYHISPLSAAVEVLWFNGIVVVVSAGNNGAGATNGILYAPANDPFVITVGAVDDKGTASVTDDVQAAYSAYGVTSDGVAKPDIMAPGSNIIAPLASGGAELAAAHPTHKVDGKTDYFRMSGTSTAAAVTTGAVALLLQDEPNLTPDQVKYRLLNTPSRQISMGGRNVPYLNVYNAVVGTTTQSSNTGIRASQLLWTGSNPVTWGSVNWNSVNWNSVNWD
jgi:serine protease AprX